MKRHAGGEDLTKRDYVIRERRQSKYDPDATFTVETGIRCPRCKAVLPFIDHGESQKCGRCKLNMETHGNGLEVWD